MLIARDVVVRRSGNTLLDRVSIDVPPARLTMLIGPNGAGKSTLLRLLSGAMKADAGDVLLDGRPLTGWSSRQMATRRAVVPQSMDIAFRFSAYEVVELGLGEGRAEGVVRHAMRLTDCERLADRQYADLSGGERARVQVARALAQLRVQETASTNDADRYLLLDEPVASLDPGQQHRLLALLVELVRSQGIGVLVTMHDLNLASQYAQQVSLLQAGRLGVAGVPEDVIAPTWIRPVFDVDLHPLGEGRDSGLPRAVATIARAAGDRGTPR